MGHAVLGFAGAVWLVALRPWRWAMNDLAVYRAGSLGLRHGRALYTTVAGADHLHFTYPPFAAVVLAPFAALPWSLDRLALTVTTVACYALCLWLVCRQLTREGAAYPSWWLPVALAIAIWLEPFRSTVSLGQINVVLMAMILTDLLAIRSDRRSGWLIGVAGAIKLTPLAFVPYLFASGRTRAGANAVAGFVVAGVVGFATDPAGSREYWGQRLFLEPHRVGRVANASNQTVRGILARLLRSTDVPGWWVAVAVVVFLAGLVIAVQLSRAGRLACSVTVMAIAMLCASPISWSHHWVWSAPMLVVGADLARRHRVWWAWLGIGFVLLPFLVGLIFWAPHRHDAELTDSTLQQLTSATYVLSGVALTVVLSLQPRWPSAWRYGTGWRRRG